MLQIYLFTYSLETRFDYLLLLHFLFSQFHVDLAGQIFDNKLFFI